MSYSDHGDEVRLAAVWSAQVLELEEMSPRHDSARRALEGFWRRAEQVIGWHRGRVAYRADDWVLAVFDRLVPAHRAARSLAYDFPHADFANRGCRVRVGLSWGQVQESDSGGLEGPAVDEALQYEAVAPAGRVRYSWETNGRLREELDAMPLWKLPRMAIDALFALAYYDPFPQIDSDAVRARLLERGVPTLASQLEAKDLR